MISRFQRGFTILELMIGLAVLVILITVALPNMRSAIQNNRMTAQANSFITAFQLARSEAVKRRAPVSICASSDGASCTGAWEDGWIVFVDGNAAGDGSASIGEILQVWQGLEGDISNAGDDPDFVRYVGSGIVDRNAGITFPVTFELEVPGCTTDSNREIEVSVTGRAGAKRVDCS